MTAHRSAQPVSIDDAARMLGVEPAAVRLFVRQHFLRLVGSEPAMVCGPDVARLRRVMERRTREAPCRIA
jgi:hypothetical protein